MDLDRLRAELTRDEGCELRPYRDSKGFLTVGVGHNLDAKGISQHIADQMLIDDIADAMTALDAALPWWQRLDPVRQRALCNLCFNMGIGNDERGLLSFRNTLASLEAGNYEIAASGFLNSKWARDVGPRRAERICDLIRTGKDVPA